MNPPCRLPLVPLTLSEDAADVLPPDDEPQSAQFSPGDVVELVCGLPADPRLAVECTTADGKVRVVWWNSSRGLEIANLVPEDLRKCAPADAGT